MAGVDQILSFVVQQGADELRLGTDQEPQVFAAGARRRFTMSATSEPVLRQLLGNILTPERESELASLALCTFEYAAGAVGRFHVQMSRAPSSSLEVVFRHQQHNRVPSTEGAAQSATSTPHVASAQGSPDTATNARLAAATSSDAATNARLAATTSSATATERNPRLAAATVVATAPERRARPPSATSSAIVIERIEARGDESRLASIVARAVQARASDIHLADGQPVFIRIDGRLRVVADEASASPAQLFGLDSCAVADIMSGHACEFALTLSPRERLRVSLYRMESGLAAAIRLLPTTAPDLGELNLPLPLHPFAELPHGLVLACGATGSGKSTTLAALARHALEHRSILVVTLEDPIEFTLVGTEHSIVRQRQVGRDVVDFTTGLRDALRGDPDVIVVGELRDAETIRLAITAAETGHLVLGSLHSGSAAGCIERIVDAYPTEQRAQVRVQLADALRGVIVQRLVPRAKGTGRIPALEILKVTHGVANVIREGKTAQVGSMVQSGKREGMISLERCLAEYVQAGMISVESAKSFANDVDSLTMYLGK